MSLRGNFNRAENGFEFPKGEFGEGKFHLKTSEGKILIRDGEEMIASAELPQEGDQGVAEFNLIKQLEGEDEKFLEVVGGSDYLKDFLEKIVTEDLRSN